MRVTTMKQAFFNFLFILLFIINNSSQLIAMEQQELGDVFSLVADMIQSTGNKKSLVVVNHLHTFRSLNNNLLEEMKTTKNGMPQDLKEKIVSLQATSEGIIKGLEQDPHNVKIYTIIHPIFTGITLFINDLEKESSEQPVIINYLEKYYRMLGEFTSQTLDIRQISHYLPRSN
jgi:hypothetical protein